MAWTGCGEIYQIQKEARTYGLAVAARILCRFSLAYARTPYTVRSR